MSVRKATVFIICLCVFLPCRASVRETYDVVSLFQVVRTEHPQGGALPRTRDLLAAILLDPASPYSGTLPSPAFARTAAWQDMVAALPEGLNGGAALAILAHDLGASKTQPALEIAGSNAFREPFVAASAAKAGIDPDIFWKAIDLTGYRHSTRAATYGVALQIVRDEAAVTPPSLQRPKGVDLLVLDRVMQASDLGDVRRSDLDYLSVLVQHGIIHWRPAFAPHPGHRPLPVPLRIARLAAAYRDAQGYVGGYPCNSDATPHATYAGTGNAGDDRPLCFVAATDYGVLRWYRDEVRRQAAWRPAQTVGDKSGLLALFALLVPLFDLAALVESTEAVIAEDLVASRAFTHADAMELSEEADLLACRIPQ
jgi:hypothetical protein